MKINEELKNDFICVSTDDIKISTNEQKVIGTSSLAPCMGFVLYNKESKKAIVGHISSRLLQDDYSLMLMREKIIFLIKNNNLENKSFELFLIEGAQKSRIFKEWYELDILKNLKMKRYPLFEILEINIKIIPTINIVNTKKDNYSLDEIHIIDLNNCMCDKDFEEASKQFAFNSNTGKFITNDVFIIDPEKEKNIR